MRKKLRLLLILVLFAILCLLVSYYELRTSRFQAWYFSKVAQDLTFRLKPGQSNSIRFPKYGPHDIRLGYTKIPQFVKYFSKEGFYVEAQAEISDRLLGLIDRGIFPIYREKTQAGLQIFDRYNKLVYSVRRPGKVYSSFESIPQIVVDSLLFIENREILDSDYPYRNPAVEWDRFAYALYEKFLQIFQPQRSATGGSTIATQLEKYLHSYEGRTRNASDKLQQMLSASYRAYLEGEKTYGVRREIVLDYINSIPLSALPGYGEVNGLSDGLKAWYSVDLEEVNSLLSEYSQENAKFNAQKYAMAYKQVLSLFIAHRRPSYYLLADKKPLNSLTDDYLRILAANGIISEELRDAALQIELVLNRSSEPPAVTSFVERKATNAIRTWLLRVMRFKHLYDLDHLDLIVRSTLDYKVNQDVAEILTSLSDRENVKKYGLFGDRTLSRGDPKNVIYSVTLYERVGNVNLLRIQTDNLDRPFDINEGTRLDLGSTAKLRVLANYLEIIATLWDEYSQYDREKLQKALRIKSDPLSTWVAQEIHKDTSVTLLALLEAAMQRNYSASTAETFFTGGGVHTFSNFRREDNSRVVTVQEAMRNSINLPFIRIMRDNLNYYKAQLSDDEMDAENKESKRQKYLAKFADQEGSYFMRTFFNNYRGKDKDEIVDIFVRRLRATPKKLAVVFRHIEPEKTIEEFGEFIARYLPQSTVGENVLRSLYDTYAPGKYSLNDQGYLAGIHPLELWLVGYMYNNPGAAFPKMLEESTEQRQEVYQWLMRRDRKRAQDVRIRSIIEAEAFTEMHRDWRKHAYPFQSMVPSLASALGNSGDRPAALAELMGIIINRGMRYPTERIDRLQFARRTPFETILTLKSDRPGQRVMRAEVAAVLKAALQDVVENGTARRVNKVFKNSEGEAIVVGGKTGTGDHRYDTYGRGGTLISSRVVNRSATFAFYIGDRFFGTVTAHVQGAEAANYDFTSALAAELLKALSPALEPLIQQ